MEVKTAVGFSAIIILATFVYIAVQISKKINKD